MGTVEVSPLYRHDGSAMLRAAVSPLNECIDWWPDLADPMSCQTWLFAAWRHPGFADAVRYASRGFGRRIDAMLSERVIPDVRKVRRATASLIRYMVRFHSRATPFGLFAGVAPMRAGAGARAVWGTGHRPLIRVDTVWLTEVVRCLETTPGLLGHLKVAFNDLAVERAGRLHLSGPDGRISVRCTRAVRAVRDAAASPVGFAALVDIIAATSPGVSAETVLGALRTLVSQGILVTNLRPHMTIVDPLAHVIGVLSDTDAATTIPSVAATIAALQDIQARLSQHNEGSESGAQAAQRTALIRKMREVSAAGRSPIAGELHLDCAVEVPSRLAADMAGAASALMRLSRHPRHDPAWDDWCRAFCERYGTGALVPVSQALHPDTGLGFPATYPDSQIPPGTPETVTDRDEHLLALAWAALAQRDCELTLSDATIARITAAEPIDSRYIPAHVELGAQVHATSLHALQAGDYTFAVRPARAIGTLTSRFGPAVNAAGFDQAYATVPPATEGALAVQLTFPPLSAHSENVSRIPAHLPHVLALGEHRDSDASVIRLDDLAIVAARDGLHLVSVSRQRIIDPQVFHALAMEKQAPPIARFVAMLTRGFTGRYHEFDWGPAARRLTYLPRVRYRRAILSSARWQLKAAKPAPDLNACPDISLDPTWAEQFAAWRAQWKCPDVVELRDGDQSLRLDLTHPAHLALLREHLAKHGSAIMTEAESPQQFGWIGGRVHEVVMPFVKTAQPVPNPLLSGPMPLVTNTVPAHLPCSAGAQWLSAHVFAHPDSLTEIIRAHLPRLVQALDGTPAYWFVRYRSPHETDHLRLRVRVNGAPGSTATAIGTWAESLCNLGLAARLTFATYHPEVGRYGSGLALAAAEAVFAADSDAVVRTHRSLTAEMIDPVALTAVSLFEIVDVFLGGRRRASNWLADRLPTSTTVPVNRDVAGQVVHWAITGTLPNDTEVPAPVARAWQARRAALGTYRSSLPGDIADAVLPALLHLHHNRMRGVDRADEAICYRLARWAALAVMPHTAGTRA